MIEQTLDVFLAALVRVVASVDPPKASACEIGPGLRVSKVLLLGHGSKSVERHVGASLCS